VNSTPGPNPLEQRIVKELEQFRRDGVYKSFNYLESPQAPRVLSAAA